ncbi:misexpression suppressor of ras 4 [Musca autumnalis]|uniref:misexpression suppressor of ras 4 n=1 Tax=Musca autumnalis TaxID=221902 RepID=UPI003CE7ACB2
METLNPPQPDTTTHVTETTLDSNQLQNSPQHQHTDDVETEDSYSNTQNSTEESNGEPESQSKIVKNDCQESNNGTSTISEQITGQYPVSSPQSTELQNEKKEEEEQQHEETDMEQQAEPQPQESMDISEDRIIQGAEISQQEQKHEPQDLEGETKPQDSKTCREGEEYKQQHVEENVAEKTTNETQKFYYENDEEDELLKSDEDDDNEDQKDNRASSRLGGESNTDYVSMEEEDALLKSDDEEEKEEFSGRKSRTPPLPTTPMEVDETQIVDNNKEETEIHSETHGEEEVKQHGEPHLRKEEEVAENTNENGRQFHTKATSHRAEKDNPNHRILYKFNLDDDDTSQESQRSKRSKTMEAEDNISSTSNELIRTSRVNSLEEDCKEKIIHPQTEEDQNATNNLHLREGNKSSLEDEDFCDQSSQSATTTAFETTRIAQEDIEKAAEQKHEQELTEEAAKCLGDEEVVTAATTSSPASPTTPFVNENLIPCDNTSASQDKEMSKLTKSWSSFDNTTYLPNEYHEEEGVGEEICDNDVDKQSHTPKLNGDHHHDSDHEDMECQEENDDDASKASNHSRNDFMKSPPPNSTMVANEEDSRIEYPNEINLSGSSPKTSVTNSPLNSPLNSPHSEEPATDFPKEMPIDSDADDDEEEDRPTIKSSTSSLHLPQSEEARIDFHNENSQENDITEKEHPLNSNDNSRMSDSSGNEDSDNEDNLKINEESQNNRLTDDGESKGHLFLEEPRQSISTPPPPHPMLRQEEQYCQSPQLTQPSNNPEDEASRASMLSSASYSTSSSQQLVIDHPMDDTTTNKEEKVKPLKICLKRKLSRNSEDGDGGYTVEPKLKQMHMNEEEQEEEYQISTSISHTVKENGGSDKSPYQQMPENANRPIKSEALENVPFFRNQEDEESAVEPPAATQPTTFKSLLLQQLEKPIMTPNTFNQSVYNTTQSLAAAPMNVTSPPLPQFVPPFLPPTELLATSVSVTASSPTLPARTPTTKYLCFKCKTGSFDSLAALTEHQTICLSQHSLFSMPAPPPPSAAKITTPPPPPSSSFVTSTTPTSSLPPIESKSSVASAMPLGEMAANISPPPIVSKKRFYKCSSCNTFHENWNLFLHIREIHNRHMCMYCVRFFPTAEKLALHLEIKHDLEQTHFNSEESLRKSIPNMEGYPLEARFLMCCTCEHVFKEQDQFSQHDCSEYMKPCVLCGQKGRHTNQCKAHPDSKRFSKLKKKKEKTPSPQKAHGGQARPSTDFNVSSAVFPSPPIQAPASAAIGSQFPAIAPTTISNSNLNCDSGRVGQRPPAPPSNVLHSEDSNSSSNMVIDESCNVNNQLPPPPHPPIQPQLSISNNPAFGSETAATQHLWQQQQFRTTTMDIDVPPDRPEARESPEKKNTMEQEESPIQKVPPLRLVVPKFKLRVPKEFQKPVDDALSSSESEEADGDDAEDDNEDEEEQEITPKSQDNSKNETTMEGGNQTQNLLNETTPANSQDIEQNSVTESATEAGNSQDDNDESGRESRATLHHSLSQDDDDSLDEPNSNLVRIMQEIERTKKDIKRTKKTSFRHNQNKQFLEPRQPTISQSSIRTADHNWSPTPPASPNSRWFTPRRATVSQSEETFSRHRFGGEHEESLIRPPNTSQSESEEITKLPQDTADVATSLITPMVNESSQTAAHVAQERRDTIGSDMMDIDETITAQPTQIIYGEDSKRPMIADEPMNTSKESGDNETMDTTQTTDNDEENPNLPAEEEEEKPEQEEMPEDEESEVPASQNTESQQMDDTAESLPPTQSTSNTEENNEQEQLTPIAKPSEDTAEEEDEEVDIDVCDTKEPDEAMPAQLSENLQDNEQQIQPVKLPPADGIEVADEDTLTLDLQLDQPLDKYEIVEFVRICLKTVYHTCLYCNHARRIAVNGKSLVLHMIAEHRFTATVDSITAEELQADTIVAKLKSFLPELENHYFNANSYCTLGNGAFTKPFNERIFECFQCRVVASTHKELYLHNRKMHLRTAILCFMCRANFFSFSEILCHICPGAPNKVSVFDVQFRCCLCDLENIPSPFRLMVHLRKKHFACDVCLEDCRDQSKLSSHVWKHKLHHLCYRCGIAYRNKLDITKHLFWKHGTESTICKKCLQKKWPHVYHFCIPPQTFVCEVCNLCFSKAMYLRVHKRIHAGDFRYPCIEDECEEKFISRKLLLKHAAIHLPPPLPPVVEPEKSEDNKENLASMDSKDSEVKTEPGSSDLKLDIVIKKEPMDVDEQAEGNNIKEEKHDKLSDKKEEKVAGETKKESTATKEGDGKEADTPRKKRKKSKRRKDLLEDLNFAAPNLSETDSSGEDSDSDSKTRSEIDAMPRVMLSPPSEAEGDEGSKTGNLNPDETSQPGKVLEIWQNFLKTQPGKEKEKSAEPKENNNGIMYGPVHIALSDHDYCKLYELPPPPPPPPPPREPIFKKPDNDTTPETSPIKQRKQSKSPRRNSSRRSDGSSSSSDSSSDSDSSCSCGSNCSCSSSNSGSSSSSSSSEETDSSVASNASARKRHRKKSERDRMRKRSESASPLKQANRHSGNDVINIEDEEDQQKEEEIRPPSPPKEPLIYESDLETNESETDEEFYDEHPQKLATELLAQKRAQLMAQTRLSPSHNFDIVENSRPSTPSLPEEVASNERPKIKVKKKKRDRKSSCKGGHGHNAEQQNAPAQISQTLHPNSTIQDQVNSVHASLPQSSFDTLNTTTMATAYTTQSNIVATSNIYIPPPPVLMHSSEQPLTPRPITMPPYGGSGGPPHHRMSEGSSCSDVDGSLKRSKRARRPNKFYGYTSDDENIVNGPPLMIGTRAFKPQPPPQLTWRKEDLPTPSKSILNNKNKSHKTPKTPSSAANNLFGNSSFTGTSSGKKKSRLSLTGGEKSARKRPSKKKGEGKLPPIPTLKIRPSEIGLNTTRNHETPKVDHYNTSDTSSDDDDTTTTASTNLHTPTTSKSFKPKIKFGNNSAAASILPSQPPRPPSPQTKAFNHKIPPALLPNPDFATLQYFKANNIRYPIRPPAGARQAREGESVYCYCRCPYDEVSEMIACDGENCLIEWFHFECVGIMVAPQGKWFCAECRPKYSEELYPTTAIGHSSNV